MKFPFADAICHLVCFPSWHAHPIRLGSVCVHELKGLRVEVIGLPPSKRAICVNPRRLYACLRSRDPSDSELVVVVLHKGGKCPVKGNGQMMKVPAPAVVVLMQIRETLRCQNQKNKKRENNPRLHNSRRNPPNSPAKQQPNYPPVQRGKYDKESFVQGLLQR